MTGAEGAAGAVTRAGAEGALSTGTLIVGAGQAGSQLALSLRQGGYESPVLLVGDEPHLPYQRPPLSKAYLAGDVEPDRLLLRGESAYQRIDVQVLTGDPVVTVDPDAGVARTAAGRTIVFDHLALTLGGRPRELSVPGMVTDTGFRVQGIHYLRSLDDARGLRERLADARRVVVIGGGFIGLEFAAGARKAGAEVTVVEAAGRLMGRAVPEEVSEFYLGAHERRGTRVLLGTGLSGIRSSDGKVTGVELADGGMLDADLVLVGVGLVPETDLAMEAGLACEGGIIVDERSATSHPRVVAAGDCTVVHRTDGPPVRHESVNNAVEQAKAAAATILGEPAPERVEPWFWSDQYDLKLQMVGRPGPGDELQIEGDLAEESFVLVHRVGDRVTAVLTVNSPRRFMAARRDLQSFAATLA
ncbi:NAD(P)/FAD-dependent oxidoreductase [Microbacterium sp. YJN-G]|uniref:NAD(P)/FAD-dependent oxidoreductase n=1 Tax=Microbacterium sp. YJN-G TaxID=2763257 RepID=UPI001877DC76|nr:FAD-dependent oxidoreductase [Microbacterium sp. YJN-G]